MTVSKLSTKLPTGTNPVYIKQVKQSNSMTTDTQFRFSKNEELLQEVCQFQSTCRNMLLSANAQWSEQLYSFNSQLMEELNVYKAYDCWSFVTTN